MPAVFDPDSLKKLEVAVTDAEKSTAAELVVVLARQSGSTLAPLVTWGGVAAALALLFILFSPFEVPEEMVVPNLVFAFAFGMLIARGVPGFAQAVVPAARARSDVDAAAKVAFFDHAVSATRDRSGILVFYSDREGGLVILPDLAIQGKVPGSRFNDIQRAFATGAAPVAERLEAAVRAIGEAVKAEFPRKHDDTDELPNAPRVQP